MVFGLRIAGWTIMLAGVGLYCLLGEMSIKTSWGRIGIIVAISGMICTSLSGVVGWYLHNRKLRRSIEKAQASRTAPPETPD